jgi:hypothetical protein
MNESISELQTELDLAHRYAYSYLVIYLDAALNSPLRQGAEQELDRWEARVEALRGRLWALRQSARRTS